MVRACARIGAGYVRGPEPVYALVLHQLRYAVAVCECNGAARGKHRPTDHGRSINVRLGMPDATKSSQRLRDQAERCRRLARATTDPEVSRRLSELAEEFDERAEAEETRSDRRYSRE